MIKHWTRPFTRLHRVPVFKRVWVYLFWLAAYTLFVDWAELRVPSVAFKEAASAGAYGSIVLGLLLVFRTNSSYERWWEGRKLWGQLVNESRNFCLKVQSLPIPQPEKDRFGQLIISYAYALKHHLRDTLPTEPLPGIGVVNEDNVHHLPMQIAEKVYHSIAEWERKGILKDMKLLWIDAHAKTLSDICGSCERIKNSPLSISYRAFMRQGIAINLIAWPWYLTQQLNVWWALPPLLVTAYFLIGIELIAEDIEEPFGKDGDDLPLDDICRTIEYSVTNLLAIEEQTKFTASFQKPRIDMLRDSHI